MFYDNQKYFKFVDLCRQEGIEVPIIPGLKLITTKSQLTNLPKNFYIDLPDELSQEISEAKPEHVLDIGINWTLKQAEELLNNNVPAIHFYIMQNPEPIKKLMDKLKI